MTAENAIVSSMYLAYWYNYYCKRKFSYYKIPIWLVLGIESETFSSYPAGKSKSNDGTDFYLYWFNPQNTENGTQAQVTIILAVCT